MSERPRLYHFEVAQWMPAACGAYRSNPSLYAVLSAMVCKYMNGKTGDTRVGAETLANELCLSLRAVRYALRALAGDGWLELTGKGGGRFDEENWRVTTYRIHVPIQCSLDCTVRRGDTVQWKGVNSAMEPPIQCSLDCTPSDRSDRSDDFPAAPAQRGLFPGGEKSTQKNGNGKSAKEADRQPAAYRQFTDFWLSEWRAVHGMAAPKPKQGEWSNLAEIWKAVGKNLPEAQAVIRTYFADTDKFYEAHPVGKLLRELPKFILRARNGNGHGAKNGKRLDNGTIPEGLIANVGGV